MHANPIRLQVMVALALLFCTRISTGTGVSDLRSITVNEAISQIGRNYGDVVMFHLYASWCGPCRREFPDIIRLGTSYRNRGFTLIAISVDTDPYKLAQFLGETELSFVPMMIESKVEGELTNAIRTVGGAYQNAIPYTAIFDRSGRLIREWSGGNNFETYARAIEPLLAAGRPNNAVVRGDPSVSAGLTFAVSENRLLRIAQKKSNLCILTKNGKLTQVANDDPFFMVGSAYAKSNIKDRKGFAQERLRATGSVSNISVKQAKEIRIDELDGYEIVADAKDTDVNKPVVIYHTVLFCENRYYLMQGFSKPEEEKENVEAFRSIAASFHRR
jgi:thiol-disulfide isomerase/thioredoxin